MRNHPAFKFLAILLSALALMTAVGSAVGMVMLSQYDLYNRTVEQGYQEALLQEQQDFSEALIFRYASIELGRCSEPLVDDYYGDGPLYRAFRWGRYAYAIRDRKGNVLLDVERELPDAIHYEVPVEGGRFLCLLSEKNAESADPNGSGSVEQIPGAARGASDQDVVTYQPVLRSNGQPYYTREEYNASFTYQYYDYKPGVMKEATLCFGTTSDFIVDLYLAHDAMYDYQVWDFLHLVGPCRGDLVIFLGAGLAAFVALMTYLFCAAGRKPGSDQVQPGGASRLPLDLCAAIAGMGMMGCGLLISAGHTLFENTMVLQVGSAGFIVFLGCLLLVAFLFVCAAQLKTPGGFWWRNSLVVRVLSLVLRCLRWVVRRIRGWCARRKPGADRLLRGIRKTFLLMPVTWQWMLGTAAIMLILCLTIASRKILLVILGVAAAVLATLYSGYAFGLLLDGVRRMRGGDLKAKVDNQLLLGSFQDFADQLNGLAGVADTAAEKHIRSERMKTELITNVSHDIKTPLTSIINYVDLMKRSDSPEEQEAYLEVLDRQSQRLKKLIEDLMEMSKASTGNIQTEIIRVDAVEAVLQALGEFADKLERAELTPVFHCGQEEVSMMADGRLLWRVLSNLLGNAVKYAMPGTRLYVDIAELSEDVLISVKNVSRDPLNISSDELLERFVRGDVSRNTEGSGLGLNIAKSLMELQHGQLELLVDGDLFKVTLIFPRN